MEQLTGDDTRSWGPPFAFAKNSKDSNESAYFLGVNRNKQSLTVNFKDPKGLEILYKLIKQSDVLVENFVPGKLQELGLGYEQVIGLNPNLIYTSITGYGSTGPDKHRPGYDVIIEFLILIQSRGWIDVYNWRRTWRTC